jgi:hypothetical protein
MIATSRPPIIFCCKQIWLHEKPCFQRRMPNVRALSKGICRMMANEPNWAWEARSRQCVICRKSLAYRALCTCWLPRLGSSMWRRVITYAVPWLRRIAPTRTWRCTIASPRGSTLTSILQRHISEIVTSDKQKHEFFSLSVLTKDQM